jgi:exodeoxyribonuclease V beta subunit
MSIVLPPVLPATPALDISLFGMHLIEASAGTGKTWALSALIVRLLVERKVQTRQIVATTFTRAAAAELQDRIRKRISEILARLQDAVRNSSHAEAQAVADNDILALSLLAKLSHDQRHAACRQLQLALDTFDELFINTLDSFCQKLLREFAFDIGQGDPREISESERELTQQLIHDALRSWRSSQDPRMIELLVLTGAITDVVDHERVTTAVMNFLSAEIAPVAQAQFDDTALTALQARITAIDWQPWLDNWAKAKPYFKGNTKIFKLIDGTPDVFSELVTWMSSSSLQDILLADKNSPKAALLGVYADGKVASSLNKAGAELDWLQSHIASHASQLILDFIQYQGALQDTLTQAKRHLHHHIVQHVRAELPSMLRAQRETTFAEQMHLLATALAGPEGQILAQQIRHRYPIALVDEFQDTNSDQDRVVALVYRQALMSQAADPRDPAAACLILVGDPKQAIYGFRGGDIHTYLSAKGEVAQAGEVHALAQNQRSVAPLVEAVNAFFSMTATLGDDVDYPSVSPSQRSHAPLIDHGRANPTPLRLMQLVTGRNELEQTAWRIMTLLKDSAEGLLQIEDKPVEPHDIAVLAVTNFQLDSVEHALVKAGIPVWRKSRVSVFGSALCYDLAALMQLMLSPYREDYFRRALSGMLIGKSLAELDILEKQALPLAELQAEFAVDAQIWARFGFLAAWQRIAARFGIWQRLAAMGDGIEVGGIPAERHLVNLRHLIELLHRQSVRSVGANHLLAWLLRQVAEPSRRGDEDERPLPSHSGVQLMTIHGSKGLEFPIVFAVGFNPDKAEKDASKTEVFYYLHDKRRTLGFNGDDHIRSQHLERDKGEAQRLIYVALTRAKYRQYLYFRVQASSKGVLAKPSFDHWLPEGPATFAEQHPLTVCLEAPLAEAPVWRYEPPVRTVGALVARPATPRYFAPWGMTSFSALIRDVEPAKLAAAIDQPEYGEDLAEEAALGTAEVMPPTAASVPIQSDLFAEPMAAALPASDARFVFQRGANGGNCLHMILEYLDPRFDADKPSTWTNTFAKQMASHGISDITPSSMLPWFQDIMAAPLPEGGSLAALKFHARVRELEFHLSLTQERIDGAALVKRLSQSGIAIPALHQTQAIRYLKGFIDLVYEHNGKFYVADYKSNYLGDSMSDYTVAAMQDSMTHSGYWLQAALYLVALHRYLQVRKPDYDIGRHLGGACYLYLRGMSAASAQTGIVHWQPEPQLILDLDAILGRAAQPQTQGDHHGA